MEIAEEWRPVAGWELFYEVSDLGRVRSKNRTAVILDTKGRSYFREHKGRVLKPSLAGKGYLRLALALGGKTRDAYVHDLVLAAFVGPKPRGYNSCHLNGDSVDNRASNLKYATPKENESHKMAHGTYRNRGTWGGKCV